MKQTAVEWLEEQLNPDMKTMQGVIIQELLEQAKQMEKEQIVDSYDQMRCVGNFENGETYYTETLGNK